MMRPFVIVFLFCVVVVPSFPFSRADGISQDDNTTTPPTTRTPTTRAPIIQTPNTTTPTTRTPTTQTPTQPPTNPPTVISTGTGTGTGTAAAASTGFPSSTGTFGTGTTTAGPTMAPAPCQQRLMCSLCTMDNQCSWCADTGTCVAQQNPTICTTRGWRTVPAQCNAPPFNAFLQQPQQAQQAQAAQLGTINATNTFVWINSPLLQNIDSMNEFVYIQLDVLTQPAPTALMMRLLVQQSNGIGKEIMTSTPMTTTPFLTIRPSVTGAFCPNNPQTCNFMLQVTLAAAVNTAGANTKGGFGTQAAATVGANDMPIDFKVSFVRGGMSQLNKQVKDTITNDSVKFIGLEFPATALDVKITLIPDPNNPKADLDLYVAHMSSVNQPQSPDHQQKRGTNAPESFLINADVFIPGLFIVAVVPAQIDPSTKGFTVDLVKNFKQEFVISLSTLAIIASIAVLALCICSAIAVIAKRRRRAFLAARASANEAFVNQAPAAPVGVTPEELELIPIHAFQPNIEAASDDSLCSICLCEYDVGQPVRTLACLHHFHTSCVDPWLKDHRTCPNCRKDATEGLQVSSQDSAHKAGPDSGYGREEVPQVVVDPIPAPAPLPSPRGQIPSMTHSYASGSGSHSVLPHPSPASATTDRVISPMDVEAQYPHYTATQSSGSSSSSSSQQSYPFPLHPSSPHDASVSRSARRMSNPRDMWQDAPGMPQPQ